MPAVEKHQIGKLVLIWTSINFVMSLVWALQISYYYNLSYLESLGPTMISVYCISSLSPLFGTYTCHLLSNRPVVVRLVLMIPASIIGALIGVFISEYFTTYFFSDLHKKTGGNIHEYLIVTSVIVSIIISIIAFTISVLVEKNRNYEKRLEMLHNVTKTRHITFKNREIRNKISLDEIVYLTSTGKHTVVHTLGGDIEIPMLLKEAGDQLPPESFYRVHKKHIVNTARIGGLRHIQAGTYELTLNDEDDSIIPVGRKYLVEMQALFKNNRQAQI